jgi:hypothetical protein
MYLSQAPGNSAVNGPVHTVSRQQPAASASGLWERTNENKSPREIIIADADKKARRKTRSARDFIAEARDNHMQFR